jgi:hypothetical protein
VRTIFGLIDPEERRELLEKIGRYIKVVIEMFPVPAVQPE